MPVQDDDQWTLLVILFAFPHAKFRSKSGKKLQGVALEQRN